MTLSFFLALTALMSASADRTVHGVRNEKCASSVEEAKLAVADRLASDPKLCETGEGAVQSGGWSCKSGECKSGAVRCNTQYVCEPKTLDLTPRFAPSSTPTPASVASATPTATARPTPTTAPLPNSETPEPVSRREMKNGDSTYVEETKPTADGKTVTTVRKMAVGEKLIPLPKATPKPAPKATPSPAPSISPTEDKLSSSAVARGLSIVAAMSPVLESIGKCKPYQATIPATEGKPVRMEVHGMVDGKCKFTQSESEGSAQICLFTDKERADIAKGGITAFRTTIVDPEVCP